MDINEINKEIEKIEQNEYTTYGNCYKLAVLYIVRDHFPKKEDKKKNTVKDPVSMATCEMPAVK